MRTLSAGLMLALAVLAGFPANAQDIAAVLAGNEVRRSPITGGGSIRYDVWRFSADGTYSGAYQIDHLKLSVFGYSEEGRTAGRWQVEGNRLCMDETAMVVYAGRTCMDLQQSRQTSLYTEFIGVEVGSGLKWRLQVAPGG